MLRTLARATDKAALLDRLEAIGPASTRRWGKMSVHQMVCHLSDGFRMAIGPKIVRPAGSAFHRTVLKWYALYLPLPWPAGIETRPEIEQGAGGTCPGDFAADIADLVTILDSFTSRPRDFAWLPHPIFGPLDRREWLRWGYLHMDHHLRQFGV